MESKRIPRIILGASGSGSGKTTVTCGLLQALKNRGKKLASFKCGPDYIDPMFHTEVLGIPSRNLDLFFTEEKITRHLLARNAKDADFAVIEGVMGYYDGLGGKSTECSTYDLARKTGTPGILVVDCKGMSVSVLALVKGFFQLYEDSGLKGVILNRLSPMLYPDIKDQIEEALGIPVFGYLPEMKDSRFESRHLGLVTAGEIGDIKETIDRIAKQVEASVDLDGILRLGEEAEPLALAEDGPLKILGQAKSREAIQGEASAKVRIAVAKDKAFCFYYQDNLDLLESLGAELAFFSPLTDKGLPDNVQGLIIGGGYPELYLEELSGNQTMLADIKRALTQDLPCIAECGGFMYLQKGIKDQAGQHYKMVGALQGESFPTDKLTRFGYISLTAQGDNLLCKKGETFRGHEFHYWDSTHCGEDFLAQKPLRKTNWPCVVAGPNLWAGYPHIHFYSNIEGAVHFMQKCRGFSAADQEKGGR